MSLLKFSLSPDGACGVSPVACLAAPAKRSGPGVATAVAVGVWCVLQASAQAQSFNPLSDTTPLLMQEHVKRMEQAAQANKPPAAPAPTAPAPQAPASSVTVLVNEIQFSKSELLAPADLQALGQRFVGRRLGSTDIQQLLEDVAGLYQAQGILTGVPVLPPQDLQTGVMRILLVEGRLGEVKVAEPGLAQPDWVKRWFDLDSNAVLTQEALRERLARFNAASDFSATADMVAGAQFGQTDLSVVVNGRERVQTWAFYEGSSAGALNAPAQLAAGLRMAPISGYGGRQDLSVLSTQAGKTLSAALGMPLGVSGWRTQLGGSLARSHSTVKGENSADLAIRGESSSVSWELARAWVLPAPWLANTALSVSKHQAKTFVDQGDVPLLDRQSRKLSWVGNLDYETARERANVRGSFNMASETHTYRYAELAAQWRSAVDEDGLWFVKAAGLLRFSPHGELSSLDRFYLGGQDTVRGYNLGSASGERGTAAQLEMRRSLRDLGSESGEAYVFWDMGQAHDPAAASAHKRLQSAGLGAQLKLHDKLGLDLLASRQLSPQLTSPTRLMVRMVFSH